MYIGMKAGNFPESARVVHRAHDVCVLVCSCRDFVFAFNCLKIKGDMGTW